MRGKPRDPLHRQNKRAAAPPNAQCRPNAEYLPRGFCRLTPRIVPFRVCLPDLKGRRGAERRGWPGCQRGCDIALTEIRLKRGESVEKALRRLKKRVDREGTLKEVRNHRHFEKPSERRRRKMKVARFSAMLAARHSDD